MMLRDGPVALGMGERTGSNTPTIRFYAITTHKIFTPDRGGSRVGHSRICRPVPIRNRDRGIYCPQIRLHLHQELSMPRKERGSAMSTVPVSGVPGLKRKHSWFHHGMVPVDVLIIPPLLFQEQKSFDKGSLLLLAQGCDVLSDIHSPPSRKVGVAILAAPDGTVTLISVPQLRRVKVRSKFF